METYLNVCVPLVRETGQLLLRLMHENRLLDTKSSGIDLVTQADETAQERIVGGLRAAFPHHGFVAEEDDQTSTAEQQHDHDYVWVIDPLDGTTNYWHRLPLFCISVALCHDTRPVMGVIYMPYTDELFSAYRDGGTFLNGTTPLRVSTTQRLEQAVVGTGFPYSRLPGADNNLDEFGRVMPFVQGIRRTGSAAIDLAFVAAGRYDGYWEFHVRPWDILAGIVLVEEAGGQVSRVRSHGEMAGAGGILATNGHLHQTLHQRLLGTSP